MSEFAPPPARTMDEWNTFCDERRLPRPAAQLAEARAAGDSWLADRLEQTMLRLGGEIPRVQYGVERLEPHVRIVPDTSGFDADAEAAGWQALADLLWPPRRPGWLVEHQEIAWIVVGLVVALGVGILIGRA